MPFLRDTADARKWGAYGFCAWVIATNMPWQTIHTAFYALLNLPYFWITFLVSIYVIDMVVSLAD